MNFSGVKRFQQSLLDRGVPGCELIVCRDHTVLYHECMGAGQPGSSAHPDDRYFLYSCTKPITAVAAMMCMERNLFSLDDRVSDYLPEFGAMKVRSASGELLDASVPMTVRHLMTMTAGLDYAWTSSDEIRQLRDVSNGHADTPDVARAIAQRPLSFEPGTKYQYSLCLDVLGAVIEKTSGKSLAEWYRDNIFRPLGMNDTSFWTPDCQELPLAEQFMYDAGEQKLLPMPPENELVTFDRFCSGGAGLVSTASDYVRFADALACDCERLLKKSSLQRMTDNQIALPEIKSSFTCTCGEEYSYGLGVRTRISQKPGSGGSIGEFGWDGAAGADLLVDPKRGISAVLMQHVRNWPALLGNFHLMLRDSIYEAIDGE